MFDEEMEQTCWANKYSMVVLNPEISDEYKELLISQPIPDYVTWHKSGGEVHFLPLEKLNLLNTSLCQKKILIHGKASNWRLVLGVCQYFYDNV